MQAYKGFLEIKKDIPSKKKSLYFFIYIYINGWPLDWGRRLKLCRPQSTDGLFEKRRRLRPVPWNPKPSTHAREQSHTQRKATRRKSKIVFRG